MERLEFVKVILCNKAHVSEPPDAALLMAMAMLYDVTHVLENVPQIQGLSGPCRARKAAPL